MLRIYFAILLALPLAAQDIKHDTEFRVKLLTPVDTDTSKKGDQLTAQVITPVGYKGDILEGHVTQSKGGAKIHGKAELNIAFDTLNHEGKRLKVLASVKSLINSKGTQDADEEGRVIKKKNNLGKAAAGAGVGAIIGAIAGGAQGAAIGAAAGAGATLIFIKLGTEGARINLASGSEIILSLKRH